jgi:hypothetical protein
MLYEARILDCHWFASSRAASADLRPLTPKDVAKLEPELCQPVSSFFQGITAALPFLVGSILARCANVTAFFAHLRPSDFRNLEH